MPYSAADTNHPRDPQDGPARFVLREDGHELLIYQSSSAEYALMKLDSALETPQGLLARGSPRWRARALRPSTSAARRSGPGSSPWSGVKRVVVADAHPGIRRLLVLTLAESIPCEILEAADGAAALTAPGAAPDLLVLAVELPELPGDAVAQMLQADAATRRLPVILIGTPTGRGTRAPYPGHRAARDFPEALDPLAVRDAVRALLRASGSHRKWLGVKRRAWNTAGGREEVRAWRPRRRSRCAR